MKTKFLNTAIVEDGNGKIHIYRQMIDDAVTGEFDAFMERMQGIALAYHGKLITIYRNRDVIENVRL